MAANTFAAYGVYPHTTGLEGVTRILLQRGFDKESICMMLPAEHPIAALVRQASSGAAEGAANHEAAGLVGWLSEFGAVFIPSFGFFIRSQEFFQTLMTGDASGDSGALAALGFPEDKAKRFGNQLRNLGVLLYLSCAEKTDMGWALELLRDTGAQEAGLLKSDPAFANVA